MNQTRRMPQLRYKRSTQERTATVCGHCESDRAGVHILLNEPAKCNVILLLTQTICDKNLGSVEPSRLRAHVPPRLSRRRRKKCDKGEIRFYCRNKLNIQPIAVSPFHACFFPKSASSARFSRP